MSTDYNAIAKEYQASKLLPWRLYGEAFTYFKNLGELHDKSILDLACGDGFYTRQFKLRGALEVVGVDISEGMIELAKIAESEQNLGINYLVSDVKELKLNKTFDLVGASYLLNYAKNKEDLNLMVEAISKHLEPGGRFITVNNNPDFRAEVDSMLHYGFTRENEGFDEGDEISYKFYQDDQSFIEVINYHLEKTTYEKAFEDAGFSQIQWHVLEISEAGKSQHSGDYWEKLIKHQPVIGFSCLKD